MQIVVNGDKKDFSADKLTIVELLAQSGVESVEMVSVQRNGEFVDRGDFDSTVLLEGDEVDFLYFMGGGGR